MVSIKRIKNQESSDSTFWRNKMAKRGYRGKHPYNDMKVAATEVGKSAKLSKVTKEYNKTNSKYKYDFIKSHDGFFPQATAKLTFGGTSTNAKICTITSKISITMCISWILICPGTGSYILEFI